MKPALLIDFDGTLCHDKFWRSLAPERLARVQNYLFGSRHDLVAAWMRGGVTSEDVNQAVAEALGLDYETLWATFVRDCETMRVDPGVLAQLASLRGAHRLVLATDNMDCLDRFTVPALRLRDRFDDIVNSFNEKTSKNDDGGAFFREAVTRNGSTIGSSILIDNSEKSCATFEGLGGQSFLVAKEKTLSFWLKNLEAR